jgi:hypothetical protein
MCGQTSDAAIQAFDLVQADANTNFTEYIATALYLEYDAANLSAAYLRQLAVNKPTQRSYIITVRDGLIGSGGVRPEDVVAITIEEVILRNVRVLGFNQHACGADSVSV